MPEQSSGSHTLKRILSSSPQIETWLALDRHTDRECVLKRAASEADLVSINELLTESFLCQARIRSRVVVTARRKFIDNQRVTIEYQRLDAKRWQVLSPMEFWSNFPQSLVQTCAIVDFLHSCEVVHGDLKLENFLFLNSPGGFRLALVDLDFACRDNTKPKARLFGTPDHIAPEVVANECIVTQSDNYSLGVSLNRYLNATGEVLCQNGLSWEMTRRRLQSFSDKLCCEDCYSRPTNLLMHLHEHELICQDELASAHRELLSRLLLNNWRLAGFRENVNSEDLKRLLVSRSRLLGVGDELPQLVTAALNRNRRKVFRRLGETLQTCDLSRHADYWHIKLNDDSLLDLYLSLDSLSTGNLNTTVGQRSAETESDSHTLAEVERLVSTHRDEQAYLICQNALNLIESGQATTAQHDNAELLRHASYLSRRLNRLNVNREYLSRLLTQSDQGGKDREQLYEDLVSVNHLLGRYDDALALIDRQLDHVDFDCISEYDLNLYRMKGWYCASRGDYGKAEEILGSVVARASSLGYHRVLMLAHYALGVVDWRRGLSDSAVTHLMESLRVAREANILDKAVAVLSMLAFLHTELADYKAAVKYGKAAARILSRSGNMELLPSVCTAVSSAYTRMADFNKARYWVQRSVDSGRYVADRGCTYMYYLSDGFLSLNQGDLQTAQSSFHKGLQASEPENPGKSVGQFHMNLADIALQKGDTVKCQRHAVAAKEAFDKANDRASNLEVDALIILARLLVANESVFGDARDLADRLLGYGCRHTAARLLCHLLIAAGRQEGTSLALIARKLNPSILSSTVPVFRVLSSLLDGIESDSSDPHAWTKALKVAAGESFQGKARFLSITLLRAIGDTYVEKHQYRHAEKYYAQAVTVAVALGNESLAASIKEAMLSASTRAADLTPFIDSFHSISMILNEVSRSEESFQCLLQFALDQTGAERAVLLLQAGGSGKLYAAASLNCDNESVEDVAAISRSVTERAATGLEPIVVDDALSDKRTKSFGSIVMHNIRSVACLPLLRGEQLQGILYLDHHTLPSLFSGRDLKFIGAISNFISTFVTAVQSFRGLNESNLLLRQDLSRLGQTGAFITNDPAMLRLFQGLPTIALSDVPILIQGESGTGKEIICEMLHRQSRRSECPLIKLNCAAITSSMVEAELFGVGRNAATGVAERDGKLSAASGGTLLLDEIADMPPEVQAKLLRVLEYQEFEKVGSNRTIRTDIRFICATNKNIVDMVKHDKFRQDLFYRVNRVVIEIPPLRERREDVELLTEHFLQLFCVGKPRPRFDAEVKHALNSYDWPGNVRELRNFVERCCILHAGRLVDINTTEVDMLRSSGTSALDGCSTEQEKFLIERTLRATNRNQSRASRELKISLAALRRRMKKYGLDK